MADIKQFKLTTLWMSETSFNSPFSQLTHKEMEVTVVEFGCDIEHHSHPFDWAYSSEYNHPSDSKQTPEYRCLSGDKQTSDFKPLVHFKQIVESENESSEDERLVISPHSLFKDPEYDFFGNYIPSPFRGYDFLSEDPINQIDNIDPTKTKTKTIDLMTPLKTKLGSASRSPLQEIAPQITKKQQLKSTFSTHVKNSNLQTPKTMAGSRARVDSSCRPKACRI